MSRIVFDEALYDAAGVGEARRATAQRMTRGGEAGQAGYDYQRDYALFALLEGAARLEDEPHFAVCEQVSDCFVDDVAIDDGDVAIYCQLKRSDAVTWGEDGHRLTLCFEDQQRLCEASGVRFRLRLVAHDHGCAERLRDALPAKLVGVTEVAWFLDAKPRSSIWSDAEGVWFEVLSALCVRGESPNAREALFVYGRHALGEARDQDGYVSVRALLDYVARCGYVAVRRPWASEPARWREVREVLRAVGGVKVYMQDGAVLIEIVYEDGSREHPRLIGAAESDAWEHFSDEVLKKIPRKVDDVWDILP